MDEAPRRSAAVAPPAGTLAGTVLRALRPRPETALLIFSLLWTLGAKLAVVMRGKPDNLAAEFLEVGLSDVIFFAAIACLFAVVYIASTRTLAARATLLVASVILAWSIMNAAWLIATGVQLQPGVVRVLAYDPMEFWPVVSEHLVSNPLYAVPIVATIIAGAAWFIWRLFRPVRVVTRRQHHARRAAVAAALLLAAALGNWIGGLDGKVAYSGQMLGFSSHWYVFLHTTRIASRGADVVSPTRLLPRVGERTVAMPETPRAV